jgi:uncharacterized protein YjdB
VAGCPRARAPELASISLTPENARLARGTTVDFVATGIYADGSIQPLTDAVVWSVEDGFIGQLDAEVPGRVKGLNVGTTKVKAVKGDVSRSLSFSVVGGSVVRLEVSPPRPVVPAGLSLQLRVNAVRADGSVDDVTAAAIYAVMENTAPVTLRDDVPGLVVGVSSGRSVVLVSFDGVSIQVPIEVTDASITSLSIAPQRPTLPLGASARLRATANLSDGTALDVTEQADWSSSAPAVVFVSTLRAERGLISARSVGTTEIQARLLGAEASTPVTVSEAMLTRLELTPPLVSLAKGTQATLAASAIYSDASRVDVTTLGRWTSGTPQVASVTSLGVVRAGQEGTTVVRFEFAGQTTSAPVTVTAAVLEGLDVSPMTLSLAKGSTTAFTAVGRFTDGTIQDLTETALWTSENPTVLQVSNTPSERGSATALNVGQAAVVATFGQRSSRATVQVTDAVLVGLQFASGTQTLPLGTSTELFVTGLFSDGSTQDVSNQVAWSSSAPTVASVDPSTRRLRALAVGEATVEAVVGRVKASLTVLVTNAALTRIEVAPSPTTLAKGTSLQLTATGIFSDASTQDLTAVATWSTSNAAVATVGNASGGEGLVRALTEGATQITVFFQGKTGLAQVFVTPAELRSLSLSTTALTLPLGTEERLSATGTFSDGSIQDVSTLVSWTTSAPAVASISNAVNTQGRVTANAVGNATITASLGRQTAQATVTVSPATLTGLQLQPALTSLPLGASQQFRATGSFSDGSTRDVTAQVSWSSSGPALSVGASGLVQAARLGTAQVVVRDGSVEARISVNVTPAVFVRLEITPTATSVPLGVVVPFVAIAIWSDGTTQDVTSQATWDSDERSVANISNVAGSNGRTTTLAVGAATISATHLGETARATLTVVPAALERIEVTPSTLRIASGTRARFQATGRFTDGRTVDLTTQVVWSVSDLTIASVENQAPFMGRVSTLNPGLVQVRATRQGLVGEATLTSAAISLTTISISPPTPTAAAGYTLQLAATGVFSDATTQDLTDQVAWSSSDPSRATISNAPLTEGLVRALAVGVSTISASTLGQTGTISFQVTNAILTGLEIVPRAVSVPRGLTHDFVATGTFSDGSTADVTDQVTWGSADPTIVSISNTAMSRGRATALQLGSTRIEASLSGQQASATITVSPAVLRQLQVTPAMANVPAGLSRAFTATGIFSDGSSTDLTDQVSWTSSDAAVATVSNATGAHGLVRSLVPGSVAITASQGMIAGSASLTVTAAALVALQVSPPALSIPRGLTRQLTATGVYSNGSTQDLTVQATWSSTSITTASVSNAPGSEGLVSAIDRGTASVTASFGGESATTEVTVTAATLQTIQVDPPSPTISAGLSLPLSATGVYSDSSTQDITAQVTWSSSDPSVAAVSNTVGSEGLVVGVTVGTSVISATLNTVVASTTVTVTPAVLQQIQVTPANTSRPKGLSLSFVATGVFSDATTQDLTTQVTWTSTNTVVASVSNAAGQEGRALAQNVGATTIRAALGALVGTTPLTVSPAELVRVDLSPSNVTLPLGTVRQFQALGRYTDGTTQVLTTQASWVSSNTAIVDVSNASGSEGLATTLAIGSAQLTASFGTFSATANLTITQAALASIEISPTSGSTPLGFTRQLIAIGHYTDATTQVLTSQVTWASSDVTRALISNAAASRGLLSTVNTGSVTITATLGAVSGSTSHTISNASLVSLSIPTGSIALSVSGTQQLVALGTYSDGSSQTLTDSVTWSSSAPAVASVSNAAQSQGLVTGITAGSATITAQIGAVTTSIQVSVSN